MNNETLNTGGPAFPVKGGQVEIDPETKAFCMPSTGMTLRDYFAAKAMVRLVGANEEGVHSAETLAMLSYRLADAMLKERCK